ncbi:MAG TPA: helix-turn-helix domain-containing protein [Solirubrobacteraceae bacterium]|nr:helix-turn-helix domain-containing protein [Solirubrobacteraceae bacterium]
MVHVVKQPGRADARRNRQAILDAARVEFAEHGDAAQMDQIAARAGVGVGTIYRHFATKDALLGELVDERFRAFAQDADAVAAQDGPAFERFRRMLVDNAESIARDAGTRFAILRGGDEVWRHAEAARERLLDACRPLLDEARADGDLRPDFRVEEIGVLMCGVCAAMDYKPEAWRRHLEIVLDGLRA